MEGLRRMSRSKIDVHGLTGSSSEPALSNRRRRNSFLGGANPSIDIKEIQTNSGPPVLMEEIDIHFEGDGLLGIVFENKDEIAVVKGTVCGTVASEYIELVPGMIVHRYNKKNCSSMSYRVLMIKLIEVWSRDSQITITFKRRMEIKISDENASDSFDSSGSSVSSDSSIEVSIDHPYIHELLVENECEDYYEALIELGATTFRDLEFIEYSDLEEIGIPKLKRRRLFRSIQLKINPHMRKCKSDVFPEVSSPEAFNFPSEK